MKVSIACNYCGKRWESNYNANDTTRCSVCGDTNLIIKDADKKINYYEGNPPFKEEELTKDIDYYFGTGFRGD